MVLNLSIHALLILSTQSGGCQNHTKYLTFVTPFDVFLTIFHGGMGRVVVEGFSVD